MGNDELKPDTPWGFAVYRTSYSDEISWRKMRQHIETCVQDTLGHPLHHVRRTLRNRHQVTFVEDKQRLDSASPVEVKVHLHPDYEDGWMIDHDEGPNGWIYVRASNYVQLYNDLNEWYNDWDEEHMFMYPSVVYEELGLKRSPGFWRQQTNAYEK